MLLSLQPVTKGVYQGLSWTRGSETYDGKGRLTVLSSSGAPQTATLYFRIVSTNGLSGSSAEQVWVFTNIGNAKGTRLVAPEWLEGRKFPRSVSPDEADFALEIPVNELETKGLPLVTLAFYDRVTDGDVRKLQRGLESQRVLESGDCVMEFPLGTLAEYYSTENPGPEGRPSVTMAVRAVGVPSGVWRKRTNVLSVSARGSQYDQMMTRPDKIRERYDAQMSYLTSKYPGVAKTDPVIEKIYLDRICYGGKDQCLAVPFGAGIMTRCGRQPIDAETLAVIMTVGYLMTTGFSEFSQVHPASTGVKVDASSLGQDLARECIQAGLTLVTSLISYLNDDRCHLDAKQPGRVRVEAPSYALETGCLDCEDGSCLVCMQALALKAFSEVYGVEGSGRPPTSGGYGLVVSLLDRPKLSVSVPSMMGLAAKMSRGLADVTPCLTLIDHYRPGKGLMGMDYHNPHATVVLLPRFQESVVESAVPPSSVSLGALISNRPSVMAGVLVDSINPVITPALGHMRSLDDIEEETRFLETAAKRAWSDWRSANPTGPTGSYERSLQVLRVFSTQGGEYTAMDLTSSPPTLGCAFSDISRCTLEPFVPLLTKEQFETASYLADVQHPLQPLVLTQNAGLTCLFVLGSSGSIPYGRPPTARVHLAAYTKNDLKEQVSVSIAESTRSRVVAAFKLELPGIIEPSVILMSWIL